MKLKDGFVLRTIAGETVVVPSGDELDLSFMITLNETGAFLWKRLEEETTQEQLVQAVLAEYDISAEDADRYISKFVEKLEAQGFLESKA